MRQIEVVREAGEIDVEARVLVRLGGVFGALEDLARRELRREAFGRVPARVGGDELRLHRLGARERQLRGEAGGSEALARLLDGGVVRVLPHAARRGRAELDVGGIEQRYSASGAPSARTTSSPPTVRVQVPKPDHYS